jgi:hypothetical protein
MKKLIVILAAIAMVGAFTATSIAAEWNFYGSSRMNTVYYDKSKEVAGDNQVIPPVSASFDDQDLTWTTQSNARIGAKVKASDAVSGRFEFQVGQSAEVKTRLMYGTYNFGSGTLLVGQDYTPVDQILSNSIGALSYQITGTSPVVDGEGDALTIGSFYESRKPQIALKFGGLTLAFISPATTSTTTYSDIDTTIPKVEVNYKFKTDMFSITPYAGYNTVDMTNTANDNSISVDSYVVGAAGKVNFGPMWVAANIFFAQNPENYGRLNDGLFDEAIVNGTDTEDADCWGGQVIAGFKASDMLAFQAGYSYDHNEIDVAGVTGENDPSHWYVNATITLAPGVYIIPEVGMFDFGDDDNGLRSLDQGDATYYGVEWKINF